MNVEPGKEATRTKVGRLRLCFVSGLTAVVAASAADYPGTKDLDPGKPFLTIKDLKKRFNSIVVELEPPPRNVVLLDFDGDFVESAKTTLLVPRKDLIEAFDYYSRPKSGTPSGQGGGNGRQPSNPGTNRTPAAAAAGRAP